MEKHLIERNDRLLLPDNVAPKKYVLHITPNIEEFTFNGNLDIHLNVNKPTNTVVLHALELKIHSATINSVNRAIKIDLSEEEEIVVLVFENTINVSDHETVLSIIFEGIHNDKMIGFYRSSYKGADGSDKFMVTTQFEPTDARRCFPCFDEPSLKAVYDICLTVKSNLTAISNMPEKSVKVNQDGTKTVHFMETPLVSSYLIAMIVGELEYIEDRTKDGVLVRVYKVLGSPLCSKFALKVTCDVLSFFNDFFGVPYPLSKCDQIAIPDFAMGAMENWGLVTYRESLLLTSDKTTTYIKQSIASVIGHEIAHQWFGNLVTMEWWSQLWLNEGFASFMEYVVSDHLFPEWNKWMEFNQDFRGGALSLDALENSHPIEVPVRSSAQIDEIFDTISYYKGSCVIHMINDRLGDHFRLGLSKYIKKHSYKNTNTEDLWQSLSEQSGVDVKLWVDNFTKESGFPIISFKSTSTPGTFKLEQKKFRNSNETHSDDPIWVCFIKVQTDNGAHQFILDKKESIVTIPNFNQNGWIKPNYGQKGYYRMNLDSSIIKSLEPRIKSLELPAPDRLGLISDSFYLCKSLSASINVFLDLLPTYVNETEEVIWIFIIQQFDYLYDLIGREDPESQAKLSKTIVKLVKPIGNRLGFEKKAGESSGDTNLRDKVLGTLGICGDQETVDKARQLYKEYIANPKSLDADIFTAVLKTVMTHGGADEQSQLIQQFKKSDEPNEKEIILRAISMNEDPELIRKALDFSLSKDVKHQITDAAWRGVPANSTPVVWKYYVDNFESINNSFKDSGLYDYMVSSTFEVRFSSIEQHDTYKKFFEDHPIPICERNIKQNLESGLDNMKFYQSCKEDLLNWINKQQ